MKELWQIATRVGLFTAGFMLANVGYAQTPPTWTTNPTAASAECKALEDKTLPSSQLTTPEARIADALRAMEYLDRNCGIFSPEQRAEYRKIAQGGYQSAVEDCKRQGGRSCGSSRASNAGAGPHQSAAPTTRQMAGESSAGLSPQGNSRSSRESPVRKAASSVTNANSGGRPIWPSDMEPGNVYFVVETGTGQEEYAPIMVSALSGQEAVARVQAARAKDRYMAPGSYKLLAGRECIGPAWGAVVQVHSAWWGGACANTPAAAIEGAYIACRQRSPQGQDCGQSQVDIVLVLSGSTSWNPAIHQMGNSEFGGFGSYAAQTYMSQYTTRPVKSMQQALTGFDKACDDRRPCYKTSSNMRCLHETPTSESVEKCMDRKLTPAGLSGSIRNRMP